MIAVVRFTLIALLSLMASLGILILCCLRPRNPRNIYFAAKVYGWMTHLLGIKLIVRGREFIRSPSIYIANHQSNYDMFLFCAVVPDRTVSIGKQSILYIPFFGQIYWLLGNILIDRRNKSKALAHLKLIGKKLVQNRMSLWFFPEGMRNYGTMMKPFQTGAFYFAKLVQMPIIPVCSSVYYGDFKANRWRNGTVIIEFLPPIMPEEFPASVRSMADLSHQKMNREIDRITKEAAKHNSCQKSL